MDLLFYAVKINSERYVKQILQADQKLSLCDISVSVE
jgi:hypothetical protein